MPLAPPPGAAVTPGERRAAAGAAPRLLPAPDTAGEGRDLAPPHRSGGHGPRRPRDAAAGASPLPRPRRGVAPSPPPPPHLLPGPAGGRPRFPRPHLLQQLRGRFFLLLGAALPVAALVGAGGGEGGPAEPPPRPALPHGSAAPLGAGAPTCAPPRRRSPARRAGGEPPATEPPRAGRASRRARRASDAPPVPSDTGVTYPGVPVSPAPAASSRAPGDIGGYSGCFPRSKNSNEGNAE